MERVAGRRKNELRTVEITTNVNAYAEGSCLISFGNTKVLCTASVENKVPHFIKGSGSGWISAEYGMLPRSTTERMEREAVKGKQAGRTQEIQRLIGRVLRSVVDLQKMGERQIKIDCDVIQADGGTRTAAISGSYVALFLAMQTLINQKVITSMPIIDEVAAVSCGVLAGIPLLDLDYKEDSTAEVDCNFALTSSGKIIEMQISSEKSPINKELSTELLSLAEVGIAELITKQRLAILSTQPR